jgi:hypothetical protein
LSLFLRTTSPKAAQTGKRLGPEMIGLGVRFT